MGRRYLLTGPEVLTIPGKVRAIGAAIGRDLQFIEQQARERMRNSGTAENVIGWYANAPAAAFTVLPTVEELTGRPARTSTQWAAEHAEIFRS